MCVDIIFIIAVNLMKFADFPYIRDHTIGKATILSTSLWEASLASLIEPSYGKGHKYHT